MWYMALDIVNVIILPIFPSFLLIIDNICYLGVSVFVPLAMGGVIRINFNRNYSKVRRGRFILATHGTLYLKLKFSTTFQRIQEIIGRLITVDLCTLELLKFIGIIIELLECLELIEINKITGVHTWN